MPSNGNRLAPAPQEGDAFVAAADAYVRKYLLRGIPSLFSGGRLGWELLVCTPAGSQAGGAAALEYPGALCLDSLLHAHVC